MNTPAKQKALLTSPQKDTSSAPGTPDTHTNSVHTLDFINLLPGVIGAFYFPNKPRQSDFDTLPNYQNISTPSIVRSSIERISKESNSKENSVLHISIDSTEILLLRKASETLFVLVSDKTALKAVTDILEAYFLSHTHTNNTPNAPNIISINSQSGEPEKRPVRYTDEVLIGEGGTAFVYKAHDTRMHREVALKRYKKDNECNSEENYRAELETAARIHHHNVVVSHDVNYDDKGPFIVMEYIDGVDLEAKTKNSPMSPDSFCDFAVQALEGLSATHQGGLLHLDIKPSNIMLAREGGTREHVKLIDFGQTRAAEDPNDGSVPKGSGLHGSIYFSSPEYLKEEPLDIRTDLYSMGCTFYWALSGKFPFDGHDPLSIMCSHFQHSVVDLHQVAPYLPRKLTTWVMSLINTERDSRPSSASHALDIFCRRRLANIQAPTNR